MYYVYSKVRSISRLEQCTQLDEMWGIFDDIWWIFDEMWGIFAFKTIPQLIWMWVGGRHQHCLYCGFYRQVCRHENKVKTTACQELTADAGFQMSSSISIVGSTLQILLPNRHHPPGILWQAEGFHRLPKSSQLFQGGGSPQARSCWQVSKSNVNHSSEIRIQEKCQLVNSCKW